MDVRNFKPEWLGAFRSAQVHKNKTLLSSYEEYEESISKRVQFLNVLAEHTEDDFDADLIRNRMAKLSGGFAVVEVGGHTESEMKERRARIEDCLGAIRSAIEGGVCYGGGSTYFQVARLLYQKEPLAENETIWYKLGWRTLARALEAPLLKLLDNSERGRSASRSAIFSREGEWFSWDAVEGTLRDFRKPPWILDPYELLVTSLKSAVSVATVLLTVEGAIHDSD
jgi:chaperonin GroEL